MRIWILPMAGKSSRVKELGNCKPVINVLGRPILAWCLTGLKPLISAGDYLISIATEEHEEKYHIEDLIRKWLMILKLEAVFKMVLVKNTPPGPAASVFAANKDFDNQHETIVVNTDQLVQFNIPSEFKNADGFLPLYINSSGKSSYADIKNGYITRIAEKQMISHYASAGVYGFKKGQVLGEILEEALSGQPHYQNEFFIGPAMNNYISKGGKILPVSVLAKYDLGNVASIRQFELCFQSIIRS